ncbi:MAG: ribonuclease H-like domain-containing protein [Candidatus Levybacteria bacterium]|nr:ribonuclease H-like domain-containing protein [Candidatus Levybacteria bacterium]
MKMFLDIETIPVEKEKHDLLKQVYNRKKDKGKTQKTYEEFLAGTGLDGAFGRICCISYAIDEGKPQTLSGDEKEILRKFWEAAKNVTLFVGFNVLGFDLRFIYQRSVILGIKPSRDISFARFRSDPVYDVMQEWSKWDTRNGISLDTLSKVLGIPTSKGGSVEGKNVAKAYEEGRLKEICEYCEKDVEVTRQIYKKLTFS